MLNVFSKAIGVETIPGDGGGGTCSGNYNYVRKCVTQTCSYYYNTVWMYGYDPKAGLCAAYPTAECC